MTTAQKTIDTLVEDIYSLFTSNEPTKMKKAKKTLVEPKNAKKAHQEIVSNFKN